MAFKTKQNYYYYTTIYEQKEYLFLVYIPKNFVLPIQLKNSLIRITKVLTQL